MAKLNGHKKTQNFPVKLNRYEYVSLCFDCDVFPLSKNDIFTPRNCNYQMPRIIYTRLWVSGLKGQQSWLFVVSERRIVCLKNKKKET